MGNPPIPPQRYVKPRPGLPWYDTGAAGTPVRFGHRT
jgi:hypothetical protein